MELDNFQLGVRHLPLEDLCDGVGQLPLNGCYSLELDNFQHIDVIHWDMIVVFKPTRWSEREEGGGREVATHGEALPASG